MFYIFWYRFRPKLEKSILNIVKAASKRNDYTMSLNTWGGGFSEYELNLFLSAQEQQFFAQLVENKFEITLVN